MSVGAPLATPAMDRKRLGNYSAPNVHFRLWIAQAAILLSAKLVAPHRPCD